MSGSNAGYTMFRGSVKGTGYPLHSPVSPSLPLPCVTFQLDSTCGWPVWPEHVVGYTSKVLTNYCDTLHVLSKRPVWPEHVVRYSSKVLTNYCDTLHALSKRPVWPEHVVRYTSKVLTNYCDTLHVLSKRDVRNKSDCAAIQQ